ncbi:MAG: cytochrome P460 family protein [Fimbriimonadaceae bacterium]
MKWCFLFGATVFAFGASQQSMLRPVDSVRFFKKWTRLTVSPAYVPDKVSYLCRGPMPHEAANPHMSNWIHVYVNPIGEKAAASGGKVEFPPGSTLVKTKFAKKEGSKVEIMTVMIKGKKGSQPKTGDWQFLVMNGDGTITIEDKRVEHCWTCHKEQANKDFAFLNYVMPK